MSLLVFSLLIAQALCNGSLMGYLTYDEVIAHIQDLGQEEGVEIGEMGRTLLNRPIPYVKIGNSGPTVLVLAGTHPHELLAEAFLLAALDEVLKKPISSLEIYFVPVFNIDGYAAMTEAYAKTGQVDGYRKNLREGTCTLAISHGVDLNRNYDFMWGVDDLGSSEHECMEDYRGTEAFSEPETRSMKEFFEEHEFALMLTYHAYGNFYITPFNYIAESAAGLYHSLEDYAYYRNLKNIVPRSAKVGNAFELLGYYANGVFVDWAYHKGAISLAIELGDEFRPINPQPDISEHLPTFWTFLNSTIPEVRLNSSIETAGDMGNCSVTLYNPSLSDIPDAKLVFEFDLGVDISEVFCSVMVSHLIEADRATIAIGTLKRLSSISCTASAQFSSVPSFGISFSSAYFNIYNEKDSVFAKYFSVGAVALLVFAGLAIIGALLIFGKCLFDYSNSSLKFQELTTEELGDIELPAKADPFPL